jgi:5-hydroxyisourate hydrolase
MSLSTHVLDTMRGTPAAGLEITLHRREPDGDWKEIAQAVTDSEGRVSSFSDEDLQSAEYRLAFATRAYFERSGLNAFYPEVSIVFNLEDPSAHLHLPLLLTAFGYSTYKGA